MSRPRSPPSHWCRTMIGPSAHNRGCRSLPSAAIQRSDLSAGPIRPDRRANSVNATTHSYKGNQHTARAALLRKRPRRARARRAGPPPVSTAQHDARPAPDVASRTASSFARLFRVLTPPDNMMSEKSIPMPDSKYDQVFDEHNLTGATWSIQHAQKRTKTFGMAMAIGTMAIGEPYTRKQGQEGPGVQKARL